MTLTCIVFDVGETLIDEGPMWRRWADAIGCPHQAMLETLDGVIGRREHHRRVFELLAPHVDVMALAEAALSRGEPLGLRAEDFYPDARPCLAALAAAGIAIGIVGNNPAHVPDLLRAAGVRAAFIASSGGWGVEKPSAAFFARVVEAAGRPAGEIAYVGDRLDNDVLPAQAAGMTGVFLRRGFWGRPHATWPEAAQADVAIDGLDALLATLAAGGRLPPVVRT